MKTGVKTKIHLIVLTCSLLIIAAVHMRTSKTNNPISRDEASQLYNYDTSKFFSETRPSYLPSPEVRRIPCSHSSATSQPWPSAKAGKYHSVALKSDGSLSAWGLNHSGQANVPSGSGFVAIAAGDYHTLALKADGSIVAWGLNFSGQCDVPPGNDFVAIAAGGYHSLALRADGSIAAWGLNYSGQCDVPEGNDYITIAAGKYHSLALRADGSIVAWGLNFSGQCDVPGDNY